MLSCLASCGGGGGGGASANSTVAEIIPTQAQSFTFSEFQIGDPQDTFSTSLVVHSMSFTQDSSGLRGSVVITFSLYKLGKLEIEGATFTGNWDKVLAGDEFAITIDNNPGILNGSQEIKFEAIQLKLQALNTTWLPNGLPASSNAQFTGGDIFVNNFVISFEPVGKTVEIKYTYGE